MNTIPTHKVVVAVGLIAVFGFGIYWVVLSAGNETPVASAALAAPLEQNAAAAPDMSAAVQTPADQAAPTDQTLPADQTASASKAPSAVPPVVALAPVARTRNSSDVPNMRVASASHSRASSQDQSAAADTQAAPAVTEQQAATNADPAATSAEPVASDSQITNSVKSEIETVAPNNDVDVATMNGVVALVGTVPSQDAVDQASQAARRVAGVKQVDVSALKVSNQ